MAAIQTIMDGNPVWIDSETGFLTTPPTNSFGGQVNYNPVTVDNVDNQPTTTNFASSIAGYPASAYQVRRAQNPANGLVEVLNPATGQWEEGLRMPFEMEGNGQFLPASIGRDMGGAQVRTPPPDSLMDKIGNAMPFLIGGFAGAAAGGLGALSGVGSAPATSGAGIGSEVMGGYGNGLLSSTGAAGAGAIGDIGSEVMAGYGNPGANMAFSSGIAPGADLASEVAGGYGNPGANMAFSSGIAPGADLASEVAGGYGNAGATSSIIGAAAAGTAVTEAAKQTALQKVLAGIATAADWATLAGQALPGVISAFGSNQQANALSDLAKEQSALGAPSRARYEASYAPGFDLAASDPGYAGALDAATQAQMRALSTKGNPFGNPGGLIEANKQIVNGTAMPALNTYRNMNAQSGGFGSINSAAPATAASSIGANNNVYSDLGAAFGAVTNPQSSLDELLKKLNGKNITLNTGNVAA
jgi:hypothetical protein